MATLSGDVGLMVLVLIRLNNNLHRCGVLSQTDREFTPVCNLVKRCTVAREAEF